MNKKTKKRPVKKVAKKRTRKAVASTHKDFNSHNVKISVLSGISEKLKFDEKVGAVYALMKIVQNKVINKQDLTPLENKLFIYSTTYGFRDGSKKAVRDKII